MTKTLEIQDKIITEDFSAGNIVFRCLVPLSSRSLSGKWHVGDTGKRYKLVEGAIIVDRRAVQEQMGWSDKEASDHFKTLWSVKGMLTDVRVVKFDFRHNGINTGAKGERSWVIDDYEVHIDDKVLKVPARMLSVRVYEDNYLYVKGNNGETLQDGNLLEAIENGRVFSWSVEFIPVRQARTESGLVEFLSYHTPNIAFLDITQGIPDAGNFTMRSFEQIILDNNNNMQTTNTRGLNDLVTKDGRFAVVSKELEEESLTTVTLTYADDGSTEELSYTYGDGSELPFKWASIGAYILTQIKPKAPTETTPKSEDEDGIPGQRDITIEPASAVAPAADSEETPPNADANEDGEITDEEARSYIKEIKRMYSDPKMIQEKMGDLERMCGDLTTRMDGLTIKDEDPEEVEAQRIRALNANLSNVPEEVKTAEDDKAKRSLEIGGEDLLNQEPKRFTIEDMQNTNLKSRLAQLTK